MSTPSSPRQILRRHFTARFIENELVGDGDDLHGVLARVVAFLAAPALLLPVTLLLKYGYPFPTLAALDRASWSDKGLFVALTISVMGLVTTFEWDVLHVRRQDLMILGVLPVSTGTVLRAQAGALAILFFGLAGILSLIGALTLPVVMYTRWSGVGLTVLRAIGAHFVASMLAAGWVFGALLSVHGLIAQVCPPRRIERVSLAVQMICTFVLVVAFLLTPLFAGLIEPSHAGVTTWAGFFPHAWFVGIEEYLAGHADGAWTVLAWRGVLAVGIAVTSGVVLNVWGCERRIRRMREGQPPSVSTSTRRGVVIRLLRVVAQRPDTLGFAVFTVLTWWRSPWHRVVLAACWGGAAALGGVSIMVSTWQEGAPWRMPAPDDLLFTGFVVVALVMVGVRVAAAAPTDLRAAWVFRLLDQGHVARWLRGYRVASLMVVAAPIAMLAGAGMAWFYGPVLGGLAAVACLAWAWLVCEVLLVGYVRAPLVSPMQAAGGVAQTRWFIFAAIGGALLVPLARVVVWSVAYPVVTILLAGAAAAAIVVIWRTNERGLPRGVGQAFVPDDDRTQRLGLGT